MKVYVVIVIAILIIVLTVAVYKRESFSIKMRDTEFRGMNLLGVNSLDSFVPADSENTCSDICNKLEDCNGYSYYEPGNRCYLYGTGGFVFGRRGYMSGMK